MRAKRVVTRAVWFPCNFHWLSRSLEACFIAPHPNRPLSLISYRHPACTLHLLPAPLSLSPPSPLPLLQGRA